MELKCCTQVKKKKQLGKYRMGRGGGREQGRNLGLLAVCNLSKVVNL